MFLDTVQLWLPDGIKTWGQSRRPFVSLVKDISLSVFSRVFLYGGANLSLSSHTYLFAQERFWLFVHTQVEYPALCP